MKLRLAFTVLLGCIGGTCSGGSTPPRTLPPGFGKAFMLPNADIDQYANPVVTRKEAKCDAKTGWPYEVWLKKPRMEFVLVPAGQFMMGGHGRTDGPRHRVRITEPFYMAKYELTQAQWRHFTGTAPWAGQKEAVDRPDHAAGCLTWLACQDMLHDLDARFPSVRLRMPTEAEWEYACRAGTTTPYWFGSDPSQAKEYGWFSDNALNGGEGYPHRVGLKRPNPWGLHDICGNVWEWCSDWFGPYGAEDQTDPVGPTDGTRRPQRGGSYNSRAYQFASSYRISNSPNRFHPSLGLRIVARQKQAPREVGTGKRPSGVRTKWKPPADGPTRVYILPMSGSLMCTKIAPYVAKALEAASRYSVDLAVLVVDSPGGRVDVAYEIVEALSGLKDVTTVAWVSGGKSEALSAAALICLNCDYIVMSPGSSIGAATPYVTKEGKIVKLDEALEEKMLSAFRAKFRAAAEEHGYPPLLAEAMVDRSLEVSEVVVAGRKRYVAGRGGRVVCPRGKLLTLTAGEAASAGFAIGPAKTQAELFDLLGIKKKTPARGYPSRIVGRDYELDRDHYAVVFTGSDAVQRAQKTHDSVAKDLVDLTQQMATQVARAESHDPLKYTYVVDLSTRRFKDDGSRWRLQSKRCADACKDCVKTCKSVLALVKKHPDLGVVEADIRKTIVVMEALCERLKSRYNLKHLPR